MRVRTTVVTLLVSSFLWSSAAMAQQRPSTTSGGSESVAGQHVVDLSELHQAIAGQAATDQQNRNDVLGVFRHSQVRELAGRLGLSVMRAENAVSTLDSKELASLADQARTVEADLAGGAQTIVISVTTLLLILIIILLVAR